MVENSLFLPFFGHFLAIFDSFLQNNVKGKNTPFSCFTLLYSTHCISIA